MQRVGILPQTTRTLDSANTVHAVTKWIYGRPTRFQLLTLPILATAPLFLNAPNPHVADPITAMAPYATPMAATSTRIAWATNHSTAQA